MDGGRGEGEREEREERERAKDSILWFTLQLPAIAKPSAEHPHGWPGPKDT